MNKYLVNQLVYSVVYLCTNCRETFKKQYNKGQLAPKKVTCTKCGCNTGEKL